MRTLRIVRTPLMRTVAAAIVLLAAPAAATASILGPTPYLSFADSPGHTADSPFSVGTPTTFYLEDFEDGDLDSPGASVSSAPLDPLDQPVTTGIGHNASFVDSVDDDSGPIDGSGSSGWSLGVGGSGGPSYSVLTFSFDAGVLGQYPTHAGIVFTDMGRSTTSPPGADGTVNGIGLLSFEAFGPLGQSLGTIPEFVVGDLVKNGTTGEDRFLGVIDLGGVARIEVTINSHDAEFDHLQYGFTRAVTGAVPEPASVLVWGCLGLAAAARVRARWL